MSLTSTTHLGTVQLPCLMQASLCLMQADTRATEASCKTDETFERFILEMKATLYELQKENAMLRVQLVQAKSRSQENTQTIAVAKQAMQAELHSWAARLESYQKEAEAAEEKVKVAQANLDRKHREALSILNNGYDFRYRNFCNQIGVFP